MRLRYPTPPATRRMNFPSLTGGLNLRELGYQLPASQSPYMKNLWWENGVLQSRDGQMFLSEDTSRGTGYACYRELFHGRAFFHIGRALWYGEPLPSEIHLTQLCTNVPENRGTFFRYLDWLFYKNQGGFFRIEYRPHEQEQLKAVSMTELAYVPTIAINASPSTGGGDLYQPENRLSPQKKVCYNAVAEVKEYRLPEKQVDRVQEVMVDGVRKEEGTDYLVNTQEGKINFMTAPPVTSPPQNNTVEITYSKDQPEAMNSILDCTYAMVSGGNQNICILLAGCKKQPNAVFWNANDNLSMNPGYFPMTTYNLVGDTEDPVTGFGRQYSDTIVLKEHSVGKLDFKLDQVDGRNVPLFTYTSINNRVGCNLPWTIQLIENNLVFCNTYQGVHVVHSSSAAYENNVECISTAINGGDMAGVGEFRISGLLADVQAADTVVGWDDDSRYWLCANGHAYLWDYQVSSLNSPSWYYQTDLVPVAFFSGSDHRTYHLDAMGRVTRFSRCFHDYGRGIDKVYQFPITDFGTYERLKDVTAVLLSVRSDTESHIRIRYDTDYESRWDLTDGITWKWMAFTMNLSGYILGYYNLEPPKYAAVLKRRPNCRHVRHFSMTLTNARPGEDLAIVSAQIHYKFQGEER